LIEIQPNPSFILDSIPRKQLKLFTNAVYNYKSIHRSLTDALVSSCFEIIVLNMKAALRALVYDRRAVHYATGTRYAAWGIDSTLLANDSLCYGASLQRRRVHYEESCQLDRPADNLRDIPVISRVPDALLSLVLSPTGDRQFGIALMPAACSIGKRVAGFVDWRMTLHVVISPLRFTDDRFIFNKVSFPKITIQSQIIKYRTFNRKVSCLTFPWDVTSLRLSIPQFFAFLFNFVFVFSPLKLR